MRDIISFQTVYHIFPRKAIAILHKFRPKMTERRFFEPFRTECFRALHDPLRKYFPSAKIKAIPHKDCASDAPSDFSS
ncbi:hypothetical protein, partial [uncultured Ruminococcus sp.]|uniref:hypothetical protein n=1 Tax=uncultured Ruminococcus sp. TaxID=165186 RepID=UPI0026098989